MRRLHYCNSISFRLVNVIASGRSPSMTEVCQASKHGNIFKIPCVKSPFSLLNRRTHPIAPADTRIRTLRSKSGLTDLMLLLKRHSRRQSSVTKRPTIANMG